MAALQTPGLFGAAAFGEGPVRQGPRGPIAVSSSMEPGFPSGEGLQQSSFKVVVGSWGRLNPGTTTTADFAVNVSQYAPKTSPVTSVRLVDLDLPCSQQLIEEEWSAVQYGLGFVPTPACRVIAVQCDGEAHPQAVTMPLLLDEVMSYTKAGDGRGVLLVLKHGAPSPAPALAAAWSGLTPTGWTLVGVPGLGTLRLTPDTVADDGPTTMWVASAALWAALPPSGPGAGTGPCMWLQTDILPGPSALCAAATAGLASFSNVQLRYASERDRVEVRAPAALMGMSLTVAGARGVCEGCVDRPHPDICILTGGLLGALGLGTQFRVGPEAVLAHAPPAHGWARLAPGSPCSGVVFAGMLSEALNAYTWPAGRQFTIAFPGTAPATVIDVPAGQMRLDGLAAALTPVLAPLGIQVFEQRVVQQLSRSAARCAPPPPHGLVFVSAASLSAPCVFALDFTGCPDIAARIGHDAATTPFASQHPPVRPARHIPSFPLPANPGDGVAADVELCPPPRSAVLASFRADTRQLVLKAQPFEPWPAGSTLVDVVPPQPARLATYTLTTPAGYLHGLQVGALLTVSDAAVGPGTPAQPCVVIAVPNLTTVVALRTDVASGPGLGIGTSVAVLPADFLPLALFLQHANPLPACGAAIDCAPASCSGAPLATWCAGGPQCCGASGGPVAALTTLSPQIMGFAPRSYEAAARCPITSPGTLELHQDPYVLVCLGFDGPEADPQAGDVYYPIGGCAGTPGGPGLCGPGSGPGSMLVFAKVLRAAGFRADYDRLFDHSFRGGRCLGYIRVRILNPNGTLYHTHGHTTSVTLRFECLESAVAWGGGHVAVPARSLASFPPEGGGYSWPVAGPRASAWTPRPGATNGPDAVLPPQ